MDEDDEVEGGRGGIVVICPNCMGKNEEAAYVCRFCQTPLSVHAATDPVLSIAARADTFGKAARTARKPVVLVGMWIIFGPIFLFCLVGFVGAVMERIQGGDGIRALMVVIVLGLGLFISGALLLKTTRSFWNRPSEVEEEENEDDVAEESGGDDEEDEEGNSEGHGEEI